MEWNAWTGMRAECEGLFERRHERRHGVARLLSTAAVPPAAQSVNPLLSPRVTPVSLPRSGIAYRLVPDTLFHSNEKALGSLLPESVLVFSHCEVHCCLLGRHTQPQWFTLCPVDVVYSEVRTQVIGYGLVV